MALPRKPLAAAIVALAVGAALVLGLWMRNSRPPTVANSRPPAGGLECGHWAVFRTCELMGVPISPRAIREMMPAGPRGHSLKEIADVLQRAGLAARGRKESLETFLPAEGTRIVHLTSPDHFIVVARSSPERIFFFDDRGRRQAMPCARLREYWTGNVLYVERPPLTTSLGFAQREVPDGQPRVQLATLFIDKGDIVTEAAPQTVAFDFPFRNNGQSDLLIKKVHTDCKCLVAKKPEHPIGPEKTGTITLEYSIDKRRRSFLHEAVVETNDPVYPTIVLRAAGNTNTLVTISPSSLELGSIPTGGEQRAFLFVRYSGDDEFVIRGVKSTLPFLTATVHERITGELTDQLWPRSHERAQPGKSVRILEVVASPADAHLGEMKGQITVETNVGRFESVTIPVTGRVVHPVSAVPSLLSFGEVGPDNALDRSLLLVSLVNKPFHVVGVTPAVGGLEWRMTPAVGDANRVQIHFSATGAAAQTLSGSMLKIRLESNGKQFDLGVPVFATKKAGS